MASTEANGIASVLPPFVSARDSFRCGGCVARRLRMKRSAARADDARPRVALYDESVDPLLTAAEYCLVCFVHGLQVDVQRACGRSGIGDHAIEALGEGVEERGRRPLEVRAKR